MVEILAVTFTIIVIYHSYIIYLFLCPEYFIPINKKNTAEQPLSLILLTYNGIQYIEEKIAQLDQQLQGFQNYEFIIIDDNSIDGTKELISTLKNKYKIRILLKDKQLGIPDSMNTGVKCALYDNIIFCDQRQTFSPNILHSLLAPLMNDEVGAVSGYISSCDKENHISFIRQYENYTKKLESRAGCLIGVYGPLYAIRKSCYLEMNNDTILDDLALSCAILSKKKVVLVESCVITDDNFTKLYNFKRSKRYLSGLLQILFNKDLISPLPFKIKIMLLWHKYLRLLIPPIVVLCYVVSAFLATEDLLAAFIFSGFSLLLLISMVTRKMNLFLNINTFLKINFCYSISMLIMLKSGDFYKTIFTEVTKKKIKTTIE